MQPMIPVALTMYSGWWPGYWWWYTRWWWVTTYPETLIRLKPAEETVHELGRLYRVHEQRGWYKCSIACYLELIDIKQDLALEIELDTISKW